MFAFLLLLLPPFPIGGDSCCVLIRIYFTAHRYIITYFDVSTFLWKARARSKRWADFFRLSSFYRWMGAANVERDARGGGQNSSSTKKKGEKHAPTHTLHNQIFISSFCDSLVLVSPLTNRAVEQEKKAVPSSDANVIWKTPKSFEEVKCNQLWWFLSFSLLDEQMPIWECRDVVVCDAFYPLAQAFGCALINMNFKFHSISARQRWNGNKLTGGRGGLVGKGCVSLMVRMCNEFWRIRKYFLCRSEEVNDRADEKIFK